MIPGKVTSVVRVVPRKESSGGIALSVSSIEDKQGLAGGPPKPPTITLRDSSGKERTFKPDVVLPESSTQADVFERCGRQLADAMLSSSESGVGEDKGCDGVILCYGGHGMGKRHTLYETSTSSRFRDFEDDWEWSYAKAMQGRGRGKNETGLIVRIVHEIFRRKAWTKFRKEKVDHGSPESGSLLGTPSSGAPSPATAPSPSQAELRRNINMSDLELQCSSFAVTHTGLVLDLLQEKASNSAGTPPSTGKYGAPQGEEDFGHKDLLKTPNLQRTLAVADDRQRRKEGMDHVTWKTCTNTVDFESSLKPAIDLCVKHEKAHSEQSSKDYEAEQLTSKEWVALRKGKPQFVVTQVRLVRRQPGVDISAPGATFVSKIAFVLVLPWETRSTEGPVLTGTHLSASMLRLRAVLDAMTGVGGKNQALLRANASLATMLSAPLGSTRLLTVQETSNAGAQTSNVKSSAREVSLSARPTRFRTENSGSGRVPFVCLLGCVSPLPSQVNEVAGLLSFAERAKMAKLLHGAANSGPLEKSKISFPPQGALPVGPQISSKKQAIDHAMSSFITPPPVAGSARLLASAQALAPPSPAASTVLDLDATWAPKARIGASGGAGNRFAIVPAATPPSARAVSKLVWPAASPATFNAGMTDFSLIKEELGSIWTAMREAERYHEEALATAETELHEAEAATRRAGARATEMKKIIASLRNEIEKQKKSVAAAPTAAAEGAHAVGHGALEAEVKRLKAQVMDEQALRREAEAALASLDDECVSLQERNDSLRKKLQSVENLGSGSITAATAQGAGGAGGGDEESEGESTYLGKESSEATIGDEIMGGDHAMNKSPPRKADKDGPDEKISGSSNSDTYNSPDESTTFPNGNFAKSEPSTPVLVSKKQDPVSPASGASSSVENQAASQRDDGANSEIHHERSHSLRELPQKRKPSEDREAESGIIESRRRHSTLSSYNPELLRDLMTEGENEAQNEMQNQEENPLVLIIAVNMYKGHTEKIHIHKHDSADAIAGEFVKRHNLPAISTKNLEKLIKKNLKRNNIVIDGTHKKRKEPNRLPSSGSGKASNGSTTNGGPVNPRDPLPEERQTESEVVPEPISASPNYGASPTAIDHGPRAHTPVSVKPRSLQFDPQKAPQPLASPSQASDSGSSRPLRPVDMYRFIN